MEKTGRGRLRWVQGLPRPRGGRGHHGQRGGEDGEAGAEVGGGEGEGVAAVVERLHRRSRFRASFCDLGTTDNLAIITTSYARRPVDGPSLYTKAHTLLVSRGYHAHLIPSSSRRGTALLHLDHL